MKTKHMLSLLQEGYTTIHVSESPMAFDPTKPMHEQNAPWQGHAREVPMYRGAPSQQPPHHPQQPSAQPEPQGYTYKASLDDNIKQGDQVVIMNPRGELKCAFVINVDPVAKIDVDADFDYKWIVCKIDLDIYNARVNQEAEFNHALLEIERQKQRDLLKKDFKDNLDPDSAAYSLFEGAVQSLNKVIEHGPAISEQNNEGDLGDNA